MAKVFAVIGLGTFGQQICETLAEKGGEVIAIDIDAKSVERLQDIASQTILIDATDEAAFSKVPLDKVDIAIVAMGEDTEANILATALLKQFSVPYVVARASSELHARVLRKVGADEVVNLEIEEGMRIANQLIAPSVLDRVALSKEMSLAEMYLPKDFQGYTVEKLDLRKNYRLNIVAIRRDETGVDEVGNPVRSENIMYPMPDLKLAQGDVLIVLGRNEDLERFVRQEGEA